VYLHVHINIHLGGLEQETKGVFSPSFFMRLTFGACLCLFTFSYSFALGIIGWIIPAELFPLRARGKASSLTTACHAISALLTSILLKMWLSRGYNSAMVMLMFSAVSISISLFAYVSMPETKGLMLEDMEALFSMDTNQHVAENINCICFPDLKSTHIGFRVLSEELRIGPHKRKEKSVGS
jgi:sugar phosphate permease